MRRQKPVMGGGGGQCGGSSTQYGGKSVTCGAENTPIFSVLYLFFSLITSHSHDFFLPVPPSSQALPLMELSDIPLDPTMKAESHHDEDAIIVEPRQICESVVMNPRKSSTSAFSLEYGECMRNHAASTGGHASDGCGEFMPRSDDSLTCAACGCHRNFHRRESIGGDRLQYHYLVHSPPPLLYATIQADCPLMGHHLSPSQHFRDGVGRAMGVVDLRDQYQEMNECDRRSETPDKRREVRQVGSPTREKRFRTKFTREQKKKMAAFAESIGWRMRRTNEVAINQFCSEVGVNRSVLKVWVHNNKSGHRRRQTQPTRRSQSLSPELKNLLT